MSQNFSQIDERRRNESLRPIGILDLEPHDLAERYGLTFRSDKRDGTTAALLETGRGHQYMLLRHFDSPTGGTEVLASDLSTSPDRDLNELLRALDLDQQVVAWQLDEVQARASERERELRQRNGAKTEPRRGSTVSSDRATRTQVERAAKRLEKALEQANQALKALAKDAGGGARQPYGDVTKALKALQRDAQKANRALLKDLDKIVGATRTSTTRTTTRSSGSRAAKATSKRSTAARTTSKTSTASRSKGSATARSTSSRRARG